MAQVATVDEMVSEMEWGVRSALDQTLRATGAVHPPAVYMFTDISELSFLGSVICRPFYPGKDAYRALNRLGDVPAAVGATRLLLAWEAQDLNAALHLPVDPDGSALMVLDATLAGQVLRCYRLYLRRARAGWPALIPTWGPVRRYARPRLLEPMARLLAIWRLARGADLARAVRDLDAEGYSVNWYDGR